MPHSRLFPIKKQENDGGHCKKLQKDDALLKSIATFANNMEVIESIIAAVLNDIHTKGFSTQQPFEIGLVETRMSVFAEEHGIILGSQSLYMSAKQLQHCLRASKNAKELVVSDDELILFPRNRFAMDLYFDGECFIYANERAKFIIHPNYQIKVERGVNIVVNFITATRRRDKYEFNGKRYIKIETDHAGEG